MLTRLRCGATPAHEGPAYDPVAGVVYCATGDGVRAYDVEDGRERGFCAIEGGAAGLTWAPSPGRPWVTTGETLLEIAV